MSYVQTTIQFPDISHGFTEEEARKLTVEEFDELPLSDQMNLFNNHRSVYDRLTGRITEDNDTIGNGSKGEAKEAIDEFEARWQAYMDAITAHNA